MSRPRLYLARYDNDLTNPRLFEFIQRPAGLGIRWSLPGGVQRIEQTIRARNKWDAYARYKDQVGQRIAVLDHWLDRPVCDGWIHEVEVDVARNIAPYTAAGAWARHFDVYYTISDFPGTGNTDTIVKDILTDSVEVANSDQSNIASTGTSATGWTPDEIDGTRPGDAIPELALMSDSSDNVYDYWLRSAPLNGITLNLPIAYLQARSSTAAADWLVALKDVVAGGFGTARHVWNLKNRVEIGYGILASGTHDGAGNNANLIDSTASFVTAGVKVDDTVVNITDGSNSRVTAVAATQLTLAGLSGGTDNDFDASDRYQVNGRVNAYTAAVDENTNEGAYTPWKRSWRETQKNMTATQAAQYRDALYNQYSDESMQLSFTLGSRWIRDGNGARWPLWMPIKNGGGYVRMTDFYPDGSLFSASLDKRQAFRIVAMDYDYAANRLRMVPDTEDSRLDVLLKNAGVPIGEVVAA